MRVCIVLLADMGSDGEYWMLFWTECSVSLSHMRHYQKIYHFPGMNEICRKDLLTRNMNHMLKLFPKEYNIFPRSWCLPADYSDFQAYTRAKKHKTYMCKPDSGCQGRGIYRTKSYKDIQPGEHMICQVYISKPFIIDGFKFDLRIYVLVTSCDPFRIFMYNEGLVRFCTTQYTEPTGSNLEDVCMHLTNYAINKHSENFINHSPSFTTDSHLDKEVKDSLLYDTLVLINLGACDHRKITEEEKGRVKEKLQQNCSRGQD
ncbi:hypothetical protein Q8A67_008391 [Cirrhinus molitorella]|uniref:Tubulin tyrosine ligase like 6 n=1 Tax=Cirrhinus molitorella TaxID=172907 RepID=A0AA88Q1G6_9TELE|nr:hypothetical protein Q8A67_008391 [Cirrhinus molitorella]